MFLQAEGSEQYSPGAGNTTQASVPLQEEASDNITDIITCVSEEENGNIESESSITEENSEDHGTGHQSVLH